jgi:hypothetical protein
MRYSRKVEGEKVVVWEGFSERGVRDFECVLLLVNWSKRDEG